MEKLDPKIDINEKFREVEYILSGIKVEKNLFIGDYSFLVTLIIFSYKWFDDIFTQDKDAFIKIPEKCRWVHLLENSSNYFDRISLNIKEISLLNPCLHGLDEAFSIAQYNKLVPTDIQRKIIETFTGFNFSEANYSNERITNIITGIFDSTKDGGLSNSDYWFNKMAIYLLDPKGGDYFYNPDCGVGDGIIATINYLREKTTTANQKALEINQLLSSIRLSGEVQLGCDYAVAILRLALLNINIKIIKNDISFKNVPGEPKPSIIFTNHWSGLTKQNIFAPSKKKFTISYEGDMLILPRAFAIELYILFSSLKRLDETGRMGIILSKEVLFAESTNKIRKLLIERDYLEAVVSDPSGSGSVLLILNKNKDVNRKEKVAFLNPEDSDDNEVLEWPVSTKEINRITDIYKSFKTEDRKDVIVTLENIRLLKYNLSPIFYTANLINAINLYGEDNIAFVELSALIHDIKEAKTYDEKRPADLDPTIGWVNKAYADDRVLATGAVEISAEDLINKLSDPYIKPTVFPKKAHGLVKKDGFISQKCILVSLSEISRLSSNLPAGLPTLFDPEKILKDKTFVVENTDQGKLFYTWLTPLIPKETKIGLEYLYYTLFVPFVYEQLLSSSTIASIQSIIVPIHKSLKGQQAFLPTLKQYILELDEQKQKVIRGRLKSKHEKKEAEFQIIKHLAHSLNRRIGNVETIMTNLERFIQRKGLSDAALQEIHYEGQQPVIVKDKISVALTDLRQMHRVIKDTRALVTREVKAEDYELVDLGEIFNSHILTKYKDHNFKINLDCPEGVKALLHESSFIEAIDNIINNAEEHGFKNRETGNEIFFWIYDVGNEIIIDYANNGAKFPSDIKAAEFLEFGVKGKSSTGTGRGGAYVKLMLDAHKAKFEIINEEKPYWRLNKSGKMAVKKDKGFLNYSVYFRITIPKRRHNEQED